MKRKYILLILVLFFAVTSALAQTEPIRRGSTSTSKPSTTTTTKKKQTQQQKRNRGVTTQRRSSSNQNQQTTCRAEDNYASTAYTYRGGYYEPFAYTNVEERKVNDHGNTCIRTDTDQSLCFDGLMKDRSKCFILISKKDYYLYVYEDQGADTVMLARFDCCFGQHLGNKQVQGDKKTPCSCNSMRYNPFANAFYISQIQDASTWRHDFNDGRGNIKAYGHWFLRLEIPGHSGIGIQGSTNNAESVPGRASDGSIRLKDADIITLHDYFARVNMKVIIKDEKVDDLPFEIKAMRKQKIERKRHFDPAKILNN